ncbi:hypothetical protein J437_LFUL006109 [Ladona fulva]|uniref:Uncharacterized protein n=1 Tax=Ladona fulva TaxID=123851 RepID=A0A8K0K874_LADFU|nr:hypothetical protein J437_LFUL006109 [Ladona fulva]
MAAITTTTSGRHGRLPRPSSPSPRILSFFAYSERISTASQLHMLQRAPVLIPQGSAASKRHPLDRIWWVTSELEFADRAIFTECKDCCYCRKSMSSIPQAMHAACKVHMNLEDGGLWQTSSLLEDKGQQKGVMDHPLAKYNSKLMNSIWGLYNRYSVHNFKRVTEEDKPGRADFAIGKVQPNQASSASPGSVAGQALTTPSVPIRDASPLNTLPPLESISAVQFAVDLNKYYKIKLFMVNLVVLSNILDIINNRILL